MIKIKLQESIVKKNKSTRRVNNGVCGKNLTHRTERVKLGEASTRSTHSDLLLIETNIKHLNESLGSKVKKIVDNLKSMAIIALLSSGCGKAVDETHYITLDPRFPWLEESTNMAIDFWKQQNVNFELVQGDADVFLTVQKTENNNNAEYGFGRIHLKPEFEEIVEKLPIEVTVCHIAHEMGHYLGLDHVEGNASLMSTITSPGPDGIGCDWSDLDQDNFDNLPRKG